MTPELDLLCRAVRRDGPGPAPVDWDRALALARRHLVRPQLHAWVRVHGAPASVRTRLADECGHIVRHNLRMWALLLRLRERLAADSVRALFVKGPVLAWDLHGGLGEREFGDVDVLVAPRDLPAALRAAAAEGYEPQQPPDAAFERVLQTPCVASDGAMIDIHASLLPSGYPDPFGSAESGPDPRPPWNRLVTRRAGGVDLLALPPADLLLYLSAHASKSHWESLRMLADLDAAIRRWPDAERAAPPRPALAFGLGLRAELLGAPTPPGPEPAWFAPLRQAVIRGMSGVEAPRGLLPWRIDARFHHGWLRASAEALRPRQADRAWLPAGAPPSAGYLVRPLRLVWRVLNQ